MNIYIHIRWHTRNRYAYAYINAHTCTHMCALTLSKRIGICSSTHMHLLMHIRINMCSRMHVHFNMQYKYIYGGCLTGVPRGGGASLARAWGGASPPAFLRRGRGSLHRSSHGDCRIPRALLFILTELHVRTASFAVLYAVFCMRMANCVLWFPAPSQHLNIQVWGHLWCDASRI